MVQTKGNREPAVRLSLISTVVFHALVTWQWQAALLTVDMLHIVTKDRSHLPDLAPVELVSTGLGDFPNHLWSAHYGIITPFTGQG